MPSEKNLALATAELQRQVDAGLILGGVFMTNDGTPPVACGQQRLLPSPAPMTVRSRFDMASTGKTFTASCLALLVCDGLLDPDAPFTRYLPEHQLGHDCDITVRDLAMHVSGFSNDKPYRANSYDELRRRIMRFMPVRPRHTAFEYSCGNFILLGLIVEAVSGRRLEDFARERLWQPLGMTRTQWTAPGFGPDEVEHWFDRRPAGSHNDFVCFDCNEPLGSGSDFSTIDDSLRFLDDLAHRRLFPSAYYALLSPCGVTLDTGVRRSFGWDMTPAKQPHTLSPNCLIHSGWTGQTICVDPSLGKAAAVLTSRLGDWTEAYHGRLRVIDLLLQP